MADLLRHVVGFAATFCVHSTVLLGLVFLGCLASRWCGRWCGRWWHRWWHPWWNQQREPSWRSDWRTGLEESLLRAAMFGGALTALAQRLFGFPALPGLGLGLDLELDFGIGSGSAAGRVLGSDAGWNGAGNTLAGLDAATVPHGAGLSAPLDLAAAGSDVPASGSAGLASLLAAVTSPAGILAVYILAVYALAVVAFALWRRRGRRRFGRTLATRVAVADPVVRAELDALARAGGCRKPIRLSTSDRLRSPVAFGLLRPEVCLPTGVLGMPPEQRSCVLAHELAHLRAGDPRWLVAYELWTTLFLCQPLLFLARRRLQELAEFRCDAWVVRQTGDRVGMAKALLAVAEWLSGGEGSPRGLAPAMALGPSALRSRVTRILHHAHPAAGAAPRWLAAFAASVLLGAGLGVPGVRVAGASSASASGRTASRLAGGPAVPPSAPGSTRAELVRLEQEIADLHARLATAWRLLDGRDLPDVVQTLRSMQARLQSMTDERMQLWREATARRAADRTDIPRARWKSQQPETQKPERTR